MVRAPVVSRRRGGNTVRHAAAAAAVVEVVLQIPTDRPPACLRRRLRRSVRSVVLVTLPPRAPSRLCARTNQRTATAHRRRRHVTLRYALNSDFSTVAAQLVCVCVHSLS